MQHPGMVRRLVFAGGTSYRRDGLYPEMLAEPDPLRTISPVRSGPRLTCGERALAGCAAVVHAASVFSLDAPKAREMEAVNVRGTEVVLGAAHGWAGSDRARVE
jgi:hypothetical protein